MIQPPIQAGLNRRVDKLGLNARNPDIFEQDNNKNPYFTVHYGQPGHKMTNCGKVSLALEIEFHTFGIEWDQKKIAWYINDKIHGCQVTDPAILSQFNIPFYAICNLALGGTLGGSINDTIYPSEFQVDYVRFHKKISPSTKNLSDSRSLLSNPVITSSSKMFDFSGRVFKRNNALKITKHPTPAIFHDQGHTSIFLIDVSK